MRGEEAVDVTVDVTAEEGGESKGMPTQGMVGYEWLRITGRLMMIEPLN